MVQIFTWEYFHLVMNWVYSYIGDILQNCGNVEIIILCLYSLFIALIVTPAACQALESSLLILSQRIPRGPQRRHEACQTALQLLAGPRGGSGPAASAPPHSLCYPWSFAVRRIAWQNTHTHRGVYLKLKSFIKMIFYYGYYYLRDWYLINGQLYRIIKV